MRYWGTLCVVIAVVLGALAVPARAARAAESCPDVLVLGSRGSGESAIDNNGVGPAGTPPSFPRCFGRRDVCPPAKAGRTGRGIPRRGQPYTAVGPATLRSPDSAPRIPATS